MEDSDIINQPDPTDLLDTTSLYDTQSFQVHVGCSSASTVTVGRHNTWKITGTVQSVFCDHHMIKLEIVKTDVSRKPPTTWQLNSALI